MTFAHQRHRHHRDGRGAEGKPIPSGEHAVLFHPGNGASAVFFSLLPLSFLFALLWSPSSLLFFRSSSFSQFPPFVTLVDLPSVFSTSPLLLSSSSQSLFSTSSAVLLSLRLPHLALSRSSTSSLFSLVAFGSPFSLPSLFCFYPPLFFHLILYLFFLNIWPDVNL